MTRVHVRVQTGQVQTENLHVNDMYGDSTTAGLYTEVAKFFTDVTALDKANGWASFWKIEGGKLYFKDVQVL